MNVQQDLLWKLCPSPLPAEGGNDRAAGYSQEALLLAVRRRERMSSKVNVMRSSHRKPSRSAALRRAPAQWRRS